MATRLARASERLEALERLLTGRACPYLAAERRTEGVAQSGVRVAAAGAAHGSLERQLDESAVVRRGRDAETLQLVARRLTHVVARPRGVELGHDLDAERLFISPRLERVHRRLGGTAHAVLDLVYGRAGGEGRRDGHHHAWPRRSRL